MRITWIVFLLCTSLCSYAQYGKVSVRLHPVFNGLALKKDTPYVTGHGDTVYFDLLRFYISNLSFTSENAAAVNAHLFDLDEEATWTFTIDHIPGSSYGSLQFILGVDSIANTSGANEGDLDPMHGMYWAWNSGYIMAKLEGHSDRCKTLHHAFEFHIGGYMPPFNAARTVTLPLPQKLLVQPGGTTAIDITVDVAAWFAGDLDISKVNSILIPGKEACSMADRYAKMFSISRYPTNR